MNTFANLRSRIARSENERGAVLVLTALVMLLLLFIAAFSTDLGAWYRQTEEQQRAADVGSLNGVAAYNRVLQDNFELAGPDGVNTVQELQAYDIANGTTFSADAEEAGLLEAARQIRQLLETSGLTFPAGDAAITFRDFQVVTYDANGFVQNPNSVSTIVLTADDGTIITITRLLRQTGVDLNGNPLYTRAISVEISREGEQYFSNILRDAPTITRAAEAVTSNCGAACENNIQLNPPFFGFDAPGNGDGYTPLLLDKDFDGETDEIWAVNHHASGTPIARTNTFGSIICFDAETQAPCDGNADQYDLLYATHTTIVEYLHTEPGPQFGYLYFAGVDQNLNGTETLFDPNPNADANFRADDLDTSDNRTGIVCFDTLNRQPCPNRSFTSFWDHDIQVNFPDWINANFVFSPEGEDRVYVVAQHGEVGCVRLDMEFCNVGNNAQALTGLEGNFPGENTRGGRSNGRLIEGQQKAIWNQADGNHVNFACIDVSDPSGAVSTCGAHSWNSGGNAGRAITFERYDHGQNLIGICSFSIETAFNHCVDLNGNDAGFVNGFSKTAFGPRLADNPWVGQSFTWDGKRTFFGVARDNQVLCWNWELGNNRHGAPCTDGPDGNGGLLETPESWVTSPNGLGLPSGTSRQGEGIQPYSFAKIDDNCVIVLGDEAIFFSFDPVGFTPCTESAVTTAISPCVCADETAGVRWGAVEFPQNLINQITYLEVSISATEDGAALSEFDGLVIFDEANGVTDTLLDLSPLDNITAVETDPITGRPIFYLTVRVDTKIVNGQPVFTQPLDIDLQILVAPTLSE